MKNDHIEIHPPLIGYTEVYLKIHQLISIGPSRCHGRQDVSDQESAKPSFEPLELSWAEEICDHRGYPDCGWLWAKYGKISYTWAIQFLNWNHVPVHILYFGHFLAIPYFQRNPMWTAQRRYIIGPQLSHPVVFDRPKNQRCWIPTRRHEWHISTLIEAGKSGVLTGFGCCFHDDQSIFMNVGDGIQESKKWCDKTGD